MKFIFASRVRRLNLASSRVETSARRPEDLSGDFVAAVGESSVVWRQRNGHMGRKLKWKLASNCAQRDFKEISGGLSFKFNRSA